MIGLARFAAAILIGSFLLFQVQPQIARTILPWFGGSPSVWTTCLLFFQALLLGGYAYAHFLTDRLTPRRQAVVHLVVLAVSLAFLPITPDERWKTSELAMSQPTLAILLLLFATIGLPYLVLSSTSPLLQHWFERTMPGRSPYRLFSLSNLGSLLGLVSYPFLIEPRLTLGAQAWTWSAAYVAYAVLAGVSAVAAARASRPAAASAKAEVPTPAPPLAVGSRSAVGNRRAAPVPAARRFLWLALAATGSLVLMATSNHLVQEVAPVPFLWVLPLSLYLLTFIFCFESDRWYQRRLWLPALVIVLPMVIVLMLKGEFVALWKQVVVYSATMFVCCMICHGELARRRPPAARLTSFYLHVAAGGVLGGAFVAFVAPRIFDGYWEFHLALAATYALAAVALRAVWRGASPRFRWAAAIAAVAGGVALLGALLFQIEKTRRHPVASTRNFYGVMRVVEEEEGGIPVRKLYHNRILHGSQILDPGRRSEPITYYGRDSGLSLALRYHPSRSGNGGREGLRIGVLGLGTGTVAALAQPGDTLLFFEIDPEVVRFADRYFTYRRDSPAVIETLLGDGRITLERALDERGSLRLDLLAMDAFTGDAVPVHLITREALELYRRHLEPGGVLAIHISNNHLDLTPVVRGLASELGLEVVMIRREEVASALEEPSDWTLLGAGGLLDVPEIERRADGEFARDERELVWTDDFSNLFRVLR